MTQPVRYETAAAFLAAHGAWLRRREASNNLILGLAEAGSAARYLAVGQAVASISRRGVSIAAGSETPGIRALARALVGEELQSTFGPQAETRVFVDAFRRAAHVQVKHSRDSWAYRLSRLKCMPEASGVARLAHPEDHRLMRRWLARFGEETGFGVSAEEAPRMLRSPEWWLWENEAEPVAMLRLARVGARAARVAYVYTPPPARGCGYAGALTAYVSALALARGDRALYLFTDAANAVANRLYRRIGYRTVGSFVQYQFQPRDVGY